MNALGFVAIIIICLTIITIICILTMKGITIRIEKKDTTELKPPVFVKETKQVSEPKQVSKELEDTLNKKNFQASMDAVIKSANELMGIAVEEDLDKDGKE
jgi:predicted Holliday junction resolvase-like endonuclease